MARYTAPLKEYKLLLTKCFPVHELAKTKLFEEATLETFYAVLDEAAKFAEGALAPLNQMGDMSGCVLTDGVVETPEGFPEAYEAFAKGGWAGLTALPEHGGQGLPHTLHVLVYEMITSANPGFAMYCGLIDGAYRAILKHGSSALQAEYLPRIASGEMLPTMNLTEPHCGSDLGLLRTRAEPNEDGSYKLTGVKIFISGGEHDLTHNILHLVLARLPNAPAGSRGISLFLVPKYYLDGATGEEVRNRVNCGGIEHKMGLKASATCTMNFDGAIGWLVGAPHGGMKAMFTMMNSARLGVGVQGVSAAEAALQIAEAYAADRRQGNAPGADALQAPHPIKWHPDVQRMIRTQKTYAQGTRALALQMALALDLSRAASAPETREFNEDVVQLLTPIVKAFSTDTGFEAANLALQVMGGHGYIKEWGVEQWVRDVRIASIYEGTNGIQALDLVGRKLSMYSGRLVDRYLSVVKADIEAALPVFPSAQAGLKAVAALSEITSKLKAASDLSAAWVASDYLRLFGLVALSGVWSRLALGAIECHIDDPEFHQDKLETASFFMRRMLPQYLGLVDGINSCLDQDQG
jgi:alkylation response protein AidB-like acyl-CoA dehydrogenase